MAVVSLETYHRKDAEARKLRQLLGMLEEAGLLKEEPWSANIKAEKAKEAAREYLENEEG